MRLYSIPLCTGWIQLIGMKENKERRNVANETTMAKIQKWHKWFVECGGNVTAHQARLKNILTVSEMQFTNIPIQVSRVGFPTFVCMPSLVILNNLCIFWGVTDTYVSVH